ncbi:hypothetical protein ACH5RR_029693 [Cinchona calisaya]|uniref:Retrotransposon gag domain-containing protein n=1 Tax=Cinchona calisaya TaxID=153742 RepID=A0ABD2YVQ0_9GENT
MMEEIGKTAARQGKRIRTWESMKSKPRKWFLTADYMMTVCEKFHGLKQWEMKVEEYTEEFFNFSLRVGLNETYEQLASRYLIGLNITVRHEMGINCPSNLDDAIQMESQAKDCVPHYGPRQPIISRANSVTNKRRAASV